jgi:selenocysteine-specific elongation factor
LRQHVVIGTAGHIDHGKSRLVEALTGTHPDRLAEERRRGITIDLGFARLPLPSGGQAGIVDVPGHERFVRTMVAGASGIDVVLMVVAVDEGVMPQTREHLDVCRLLGVRRGVVALTKADLLPDLGEEFEALVRADLAEAAAGSFLEEAEVHLVSAEDGFGLEALKAALEQAAASVTGRDPDGPLFLPVDRAFSMRGFGTVVTGTLLSGTLRPGDGIEVLPSRPGESVRVRGVQVHGEEAAEARAGQRTAVNLAHVPKDALERGAVLVSPDAPVSGRILDVRLEVLGALDRPIRQRARMKVHVGTAHADATVVLLGRNALSPGASGFAQLHLDRPVAVLPDQPFILRGSRILQGRGRTVAGGRILGVAAIRRRPSRVEQAEGLEERAGDDAAARVAAVIRDRGLEGAAEPHLPYLTGLPRRPLARALDGLKSRRILVVADPERGLLLHAEALLRLADAAREALERHHAADGLSKGLSKEALRSSLPGPPSPRLFHRILAHLSESGTIASDDDRVRLAGRDTRLEAGDAGAAERILACLEAAGLAPPKLDQVAEKVGLPPSRVRGLAARLVEEGRLVRVKDDLLFPAPAIADLEGRLLSWLDTHGSIDTQGFKTLTGVTRRHAIPLSEYFDDRHVTLRVGDKRVRRGGHRDRSNAESP